MRSSGKRADEQAAGGAADLRRRDAFRQGLACNLLNPKIAVFFTSLLPQFVGTDGATATRLLLLGALFSVMGVAWLSAYALAVARFRDLLGRPRVRRFIDRVTGLVLIGLGVRLVFEQRRRVAAREAPEPGGGVVPPGSQRWSGYFAGAK